MGKSPLKAFIRSILFRKLSVEATSFILYFISFISLIILKYKYPDLTLLWGKIFLVILVSYGVFAVANIVLFYYRDFKIYKYDKIKIPEKIEDIKSEVSPDVWLIIKSLEERIGGLEKNLSPNRLALYAIYVGISVAVALMIIAPLFQKILFPK